LGQILVKVRNISKDEHGQQSELYGTESILTYKAYNHIQNQFELLYQCDENGKMVVDANGNPSPNLNAQHQQTAKVKNAVPVAEAGPVIQDVKPEVQPEVSPVVADAPQRKKPGPKPKYQELQEHTA
jgi:hypothetical protein